MYAKSEQRDTPVVFKPLYPYVSRHSKLLHMYSARGEFFHRCNCGKIVSIIFVHLWLLLCLKYNSSRQRLGCRGTTAALQAFSFVTATNDAFVRVGSYACMCAKSEQHHFDILKAIPVRGSPWQVLAHSCIVQL